MAARDDEPASLGSAPTLVALPLALSMPRPHARDRRFALVRARYAGLCLCETRLNLVGPFRALNGPF